jgi:hypothetical protein
MSEKLFKFLLSEITLLRLRCRNAVCGGVSEMPIGKVGELLKRGHCPFCNQPFHDKADWLSSFNQLTTGSMSAVAIFAECLKLLKAINDRVEIEFVLPDKSESETD